MVSKEDKEVKFVVKGIDPRQLETFLTSTAVREDISPEAAQSWGGYIGKERGKTEWVAKGNVVLPNEEFVKGEEYNALPPDEQEMLSRLGIEGFNEFRGENIKLEDGSWLSKATDEYKVLDAIIEGHNTYEDMTQVTGLTRDQIDIAIENLKKKGLVSTTGDTTVDAEERRKRKRKWLM